jgi:hypothetical protein
LLGGTAEAAALHDLHEHFELAEGEVDHFETVV